MAAAAILDCRIHKISWAGSGHMAQTHHFTKFCENWSFHCGDVTIFRIFKMTTAAILDFWNREILLAIRVARVETHQHTQFCQNRLIGRKDIKVFFDFSRWRPPPYWIVEFTKFYWLSVSGGPICIIVPNFIKIGRSIAEILRFFVKISSKSVIRLRRY